jgi:TonB-dependent receptor
MYKNELEFAHSHLRQKALVLAMAAAFGAPACADDATTVLSEVTVTGQAASLNSALDDQQAADNIVSVVHADAIGTMPDANAAEALQRIPGVSVERDQGEGRYVRIRGLGPDLNEVTINGSLVPSPESGRRAVALDVLPSSLISSLQVTKTLTPDMDASSLGGTIEVKTTSAFDHPGTFYSLEGSATYDTRLGATRPDFAGAWSQISKDGTLGIAAGLNAGERRFGSDNIETGGDWNSSGKLKSFERRDYSITRERDGGIFNVDYRPNGDEQYYVRTLFSRFADEETRQRNKIKFDSAQSAGELGSDADSSRELKARKETQDIYSIVLGTERKLGLWNLAASAGTSRSSEDTPRHIAAAKFTSSVGYTVGYSDSMTPELIGDVASVNNTANYTLDSIKLEKQLTQDTEHNIRFDLSRNFQYAGIDNELKFGAKISRRKKTNDLTVWNVDGDDFGNPSMSNFVSGNVDYKYGSFGSGLSTSALNSFLSGVNLADYYDEEGSRVDDYTMHEDINAAYVQNTVSSGLWRVLAGVRYEGTHFRAHGTGIDNGTFVDRSASNDYQDWLPALHLRRDLDNDTSVRAALSHSVVRPTFSQLAPGYTIDGTEADFGNPDLKPMRSRNLDLGIERRLGYAGVVSAYAFHKRIRDFVYNTDVAGSGAWAAYDEAHTYANGDQANVSGIELAYAQTFRQLPSPWNGLLFSANLTLTDSKARIDGYSSGTAVSRNIPLPSQSDQTLNITLGYESGPWNLRLAANHKSKYLLEVSDVGDASSDLYVDAQTQYDFSMRYRLTKNMQLIFEVLNLTGEKYYVYSGDHSRNAQYESYGRTVKLGLKVASF